MAETKDKKVNVRDLVYAGIATALGKEFGLTEIPRVGEGLKLKVNDEDVIVRAIIKKNPVNETPKEVYKTG